MVELQHEFSSLREKLEQIGNREAAIAAQVQALQEHVSGLQDELRQEIKSLEGILLGNGHKGLWLRVDRLERTAKDRQGHNRLVWGAIVAAMANAIVSWLVH